MSLRRAGRQHCDGQRHLCASQLRTSSKPIWLAMLSKWCWRSSLSESCAGAAWKAELTITKPVGEASTTFYFRSMDKYQEPFTMPANIAGQLETQRGTVDLTETVIASRMELYLAAGVPQNSIVKVAQFGIRKV
ncbi:Prophage PssSM-02, GDSL-like lipase [Pseudomonas coronafaciens pv. atropurpurea]|nr:Prophage PssSM-02, GDSL-like lipase [Pseudomonas coronafaciens pv. atropurpurea]RMT60944.1 Prophage PssSM-02, GDSL-like lipase [Pseudomonas coronafaciens pv. atropurpurea]